MVTKTSTTYNGMEIKGTVITGDWTGDPSVPGGVHHLDPYVDDMEVFLYDKDGEQVDIYEYLSKETVEKCDDALIEKAADYHSAREDYKNDLIREEILLRR